MQLPSAVTNFMKRFTTHGYEIYLVGGAVRHLIMGEPIVNWDFTTSARPEEIIKLFPDSFYNNQFGTVGTSVEINGQTLVFETTTYRKESDYNNARHPDRIEWAQHLEEDLARRDFTINAMAYDGTKLIDLFGGQKDIQKKIIRAVGDPEKRFSEDALRLMRAVRQATQLGFAIEQKTLEALINKAETIHKISWERIRDEFLKLLCARYAADGIILLRNTGLLKLILPEVEISFSVSQLSPKRHHIYDVGTHLVESLRHCTSSDPVTRFATLIHDIGKVETYRKDPETQIITFYNHEVVGGRQAGVIADRFRLSRKEKEKLVLLVRHHQFTVSEDQSDKAVRRFIRDIGVENIDDMLALRTADRIGSGAKETSWRTELFKKRIVEVQTVPFSVKDLKVDGNDVMQILKIKPGPQIGKILNELFAAVDDGELQNEREPLLQKIKDIANQLN